MIKLKKIYCLIFVVYMSISCTAANIDESIIAYDSTSGFMSIKNGRKKKIWKDFKQLVDPVDFIVTQNNSIYLTTHKSGIFYAADMEGFFKNISSDLFKRKTGLKNVDEFRKISAFNAGINGRIIASTKHDIYLSDGAGKNWKKVSLRGVPRTSWRYFNSLAFNFSGQILAGTSTHGLYRKLSSGFVSKSRGLPFEPTYGKASFYETVSAIGSYKNVLYCGFLFSRGLYFSKDGGKSWKNMNLPINDSATAVHQITDNGEVLTVSTTEGVFYKNHSQTEWKKHSKSTLIMNLFKNKDVKFAAVKINGSFITIKNDSLHENYIVKSTKADSKQAIYTSVWSMKKNYKKYLKVLQQCGMNSIVVDLKDDSGNIFLNTSNKTAISIGAVNKKTDLSKYIKFFQDNGVYVIARMVVFKDRKLYRAFNNKYAIWDSKYNRPWKGSVVHEYWCDPYSDFVRNYNIELAMEAEKAGFDEIQFDYIRFPTDGPIARCMFRHRDQKNTYKSEALGDFLQKAQLKIKIPISTDIYGFNAWYNFGNIMGQDIEVFAEYTDAVSPMMYPSHYGSKFYKKGPRSERPFRIVYDNTIRAKYLSNSKVRIRPYIQAFNLLSPTWGPGYINQQLRAISKSNANGFIFWNAAGEYSTVIKAMKKD